MLVFVCIIVFGLYWYLNSIILVGTENDHCINKIQSCSENMFKNIQWQGDSIVFDDAFDCSNYYLSTKYLKMLYSGYGNILVIGDSLSRRFAVVLNTLLEHTGERISKNNLNMDNFSHSTLKLSDHITFRWAPCIHDFVAYDFSGYDLIIASYGVHDALYNECNSKSFRNVFDDVVVNYADDRRVFFRTEPLPYLEKVTNEFNSTYFEEITETILTRFPSSRVINHYQLLLERSQNENRIRGNTHYHYGAEARLLLVQTFSLFLRNYQFLEKNHSSFCSMTSQIYPM
jgi:hypothetical protein